MQPEIDFDKVGHRVRMARQRRGLTQAELSELVDCSNNHMSHIESGQTKVSLSLLLKLSYALDTSLDFFLLDTPYARRDALIDNEISQKLARCDRQTLLSVNKSFLFLLYVSRDTKKDRSCKAFYFAASVFWFGL